MGWTAAVGATAGMCVPYFLFISLFCFSACKCSGLLVQRAKNYRVHVVLLGFIILIMFMAVLHMHWLFLTSVVWVMNKTIILSCEQEIDEDSVSFFGSVFHLSILLVSMASPLSLITRMLFIVAPVFCLSLSLFSFLCQNMDYSVSCYLLFNHRMCCRFWALHIKINKPSLTVLLYKHVKSYHIGHFHVVSWPSFFFCLFGLEWMKKRLIIKPTVIENTINNYKWIFSPLEPPQGWFHSLSTPLSLWTVFFCRFVTTVDVKS